MPNLSTGLNALVAKWGPEAASALKRSRNRDRYRAAVMRTWRGRPEVARLVLMHTNGIYIAKDERPRKGPHRDRDWWVFGIYLDDPLVRTEVDAWQSVLLQCLQAEGLTVDELRFLPAKWDMRTRKLFPELAQGTEPMPGADGPRRHPLSDEARDLDRVKTAAWLVFEDDEQAWALLEKVQGAALEEVRGRVSAGDPDAGGRGGAGAGGAGAAGVDGRGADDLRQGQRRWRLILYVEDVPAMERLVAAWGDAWKSRAWKLGLPLVAIWVRQAPPSLAGRHAFSRTGRSVPLSESPS